MALPSRLVEAIIALSIAYVAAENVFWRPATSRRRLVSLVGVALFVQRAFL